MFFFCKLHFVQDNLDSEYNTRNNRNVNLLHNVNENELKHLMVNGKHCLERNKEIMVNVTVKK